MSRDIVMLADINIALVRIQEFIAGMSKDKFLGDGLGYCHERASRIIDTSRANLAEPTDLRMARVRTFIAVPASPEVRHGATRVIGRLRPSAGNVRWTSPDNLHWTLQFLGDVDQLEIPAIHDAVTTAAADFEPFELIARGVGAFPAADRPRTLWIGAGRGADALVALQAAIERQLTDLGYRAENRRYVPHLTLGRAGRGAQPTALAAELADLADFDAGATLVDEVGIFASELTRDGSIYRELGHAPLAS